MIFLNNSKIWIVLACVLSVSACLCSSVVASPYSDAVLADNPVAYYRLGELTGTTAVDEIGTNNGVYTDSPTLGVTPSATGDGNTAVSFPGNNPHVIVSPATTDLDLPGPSGTGAVEFWYNWDGRTHNREAIVSHRPEHSFMGHGQDDANFHYYFKNGNLHSYGGTGQGEEDSGVAGVIGQWTHVVINTNDNTNTATVYVNGALANTFSESYGAHSPDQLYIGRFPHASPEIFSGSVDEVAIYNEALSPTRIAAHFNAAPLPEPTSVMLLGAGIVTLVGLRRRRAR